MSENDDLERLRREVAGLSGEIQRIDGQVKQANAEARACSKLLVQILRSVGKGDPALLHDCIDITFPSVAEFQGLSPFDKAAFERLREILRPFQGKRT